MTKIQSFRYSLVFSCSLEPMYGQSYDCKCISLINTKPLSLISIYDDSILKFLMSSGGREKVHWEKMG